MAGISRARVARSGTGVSIAWLRRNDQSWAHSVLVPDAEHVADDAHRERLCQVGDDIEASTSAPFAERSFGEGARVSFDCCHGFGCDQRRGRFPEPRVLGRVEHDEHVGHGPHGAPRERWHRLANEGLVSQHRRPVGVAGHHRGAAAHADGRASQGLVGRIRIGDQVGGDQLAQI